MMTLFSNPQDLQSHRVRFVLAEKDVSLDIVDVDGLTLPKDLMELNPYQSLPTMVERDLVLFESRIIIDYLEERYPHPPLMPIAPCIDWSGTGIHWRRILNRRRIASAPMRPARLCMM